MNLSSDTFTRSSTNRLMPTTPHARAALLMLGSTLFFGAMAVVIRIASDTMSTYRDRLLPQSVRPARPAAVPVARWPAVLKTRQLPRYLVRSAIGVGSMLCSFWAIGHLPMAQAISLSYSTPLFVTIAAVIFLHENVRMRRWSAVVIGFIGVLVIVQPGSASFSAGTLVALSAAVLSGIVAIQIKQLSRVDAADTIVLYTYLFWVPLSLIPALFSWQWPHGIAWLWLVAIGIFGTGGQLLWTRALKLGEVSALTPISFLQLPLVTVAGMAAVRRGPQPLDHPRRGDHLRRQHLHRPSRSAAGAPRRHQRAGRSRQTRRVIFCFVGAASAASSCGSTVGATAVATVAGRGFRRSYSAYPLALNDSPSSSPPSPLPPLPACGCRRRTCACPR